MLQYPPASENANPGAAILADTLMQGAQGYAQQKQQRDAMAAQRAFQQQQMDQQIRMEQALHNRDRNEKLSDTSNARTYQEGRDSQQEKLREKQKQDEVFMAAKQALVNAGHLSPNDLDKPVNSPEVQAAFAAAQKDGLVQRSKEAIDNGFISREDIGNKSKLEEAMKKVDALHAQALSSGRQGQLDAHAQADQIASAQQVTQSRITSLSARLSQDPDESPPSQQEIQAEALRMARAQTGKPNPTSVEVQSYNQDASANLQNRKQAAAQQQRRQDQQELTLLHTQLQSQTTQLDNLAKKNIFPSSRSSTTMPSGLPSSLYDQDQGPNVPMTPQGGLGPRPGGVPPPPSVQAILAAGGKTRTPGQAGQTTLPTPGATGGAPAEDRPAGAPWSAGGASGYWTPPAAAAPGVPVPAAGAWTPPTPSPSQPVFNPATGGMIKSPGDVDAERSSGALGRTFGRMFGQVAPGVDTTAGSLSDSFGSNLTPTTTYWNQIRELKNDPQSPERVKLLTTAITLARARGETIPPDIAAEFGIGAAAPTAAAPGAPAVAAAGPAPTPISSLSDQIPGNPAGAAAGGSSALSAAF